MGRGKKDRIRKGDGLSAYLPLDQLPEVKSS